MAAMAVLGERLGTVGRAEAVEGEVGMEDLRLSKVVLECDAKSMSPGQNG